MRSPRSRRTGGLAAAWLVALAVAACGGAAPAATPAAPTTAPTAAATPTPTPAPTATPTAEQAAAAALAAFVDLTKRDDLSFHIDQDALVRVDGAQLVDTEYALDVSGSDFAGTIELLGQAVDIVHVDGVTYARTGNRPWARSQAVDKATLADILTPWRYIGPIDKLRFVERGPGHSYRFANTAPVPYQTPSMKAQGYSGTIDHLVFEIAADGTPRLLTIEASAKPRKGPLKGHSVAMETLVDFGRVGEPIVIEKPG